MRLRIFEIVQDGKIIKGKNLIPSREKIKEDRYCKMKSLEN